MKLEIRYAKHPEDTKKCDTSELRKHYLIEKIFEEDEINLIYTHHDRMIIGGVMPINKDIVLSECKELHANYFLERREVGIINIGGTGEIIADGISYEMNTKDGIYIGKDTKSITFKSKNLEKPAKYYLVSSPAHVKYETVKITFADANPMKAGSLETSNARTINKYVDPTVCKSCQLLMGMTELEVGSVWNTMPCHTHDRRMESYFYFNMDKDTRVFHLLGEPSETRHIVMENEQATISPSWSIHSGVGTGSYTFIWAMAGENQDYSDMDLIKMENLK